MEHALTDLTYENRQILMRGIYGMLKKQAKSYYHSRRKGESSSVSIGLARELTKSMDRL